MTKKRVLGASSITSSNAITIIKDVKKQLDIEIGAVVAFCLTPEDQLIITSSTNLSKELNLLGSSTLTSSNSVTLPKKVRQKLHVKKGDKIAYYEEKEGRIILET